MSVAIVGASNRGETGRASVGSGGNNGLDVQAILSAMQESVVSIETGESSGLYGSAGSGFIFDNSGDILTNNHVIEGASRINVRFFDGTTAPAELVGSFPSNDLAMIRVTRTGLRPARLGSSTALNVGEPVVAVGNALNLGGRPSVTTGIVSGKERSINVPGVQLDHLIQTDAAINPGNSGGPLVNARAEVVGINTARIPDAQNIGFAVSIDPLKPLVKQLKDGKGAVNPDNAVLGVSTISVDDPSLTPQALDQLGVTADTGALVVSVQPGSGAAKAGLQYGDVIVGIDGGAITSSDQVGTIIRSRKPGDVVKVEIERRGTSQTVSVTLGRRGG
ncbi:MAG: trypsin-like peptidase domain-containing protein [Actinobacteria bacterium]|nr:trypsin-like peptidase domain-containing protein [Actinomycetota bacterium]